jgi:hypothetical protein
MITNAFIYKFSWIKRRARALQKLYKLERKIACWDAWQDWIRCKAGEVRKYLIQITMHDGSTGRHEGVFRDGFEASICAMEMFPEAMRISARRLA